MATFAGETTEFSLSVPTAAIYPVVFLPGLGATNPPVYYSDYTDVRSVDRLLAVGNSVGRYDDLKNALERLGYERNRSYFLFPYNWLTSTVTSARHLSDEILVPASRDIARSVPYVVGYGSVNGSGVKFDLIGHSTGNLVARSYIQGSDQLWKNNVRRFVSLAGPHKGLPKGYTLLESVQAEKWCGTVWDLDIACLALFYAEGEAIANGYEWRDMHQRYLYAHDPFVGPTSIGGFLPTYTELPYLTGTVSSPTYGTSAFP